MSDWRDGQSPGVAESAMTLPLDAAVGMPAPGPDSTATPGGGWWPRARRPRLLRPPQTLRDKAIRGAAWTVVGHGGSQALRLASNLVLTRLLYPEAFGLMALVSVVMQALQMFSDVGIGPAIVQHKRGTDAVFVNTAWTIQVIRGFVLAGMCCLIAYPVALAYQQPLLAQFLPVAGLTAVLGGLGSPAVFVANRQLEIGRLTFLDLSSAVLSIGFTIGLALAWPSVWALVVAGVVAAGVRSGMSYLLFPEYRPRFAWDAESRHSLVRFGRWIFLSTIAGFLVSRADRLVMGWFLDMASFGQYAIAAMLAAAVYEAYLLISERVSFPALAALRDQPGDLRRRVLRIRLHLLAVFVPISLGLILAGDLLVGVLYDSRYAAAGWMLRVLAAGSLCIMVSDVGPVHLARGNSHHFLGVVVAHGVILLACMFAGGSLAGPAGAVWGVAGANLLIYPVNALVAARYGVWIPWLDVSLYAIVGAIVALGLVLRAG